MSYAQSHFLVIIFLCFVNFGFVSFQHFESELTRNNINKALSSRMAFKINLTNNVVTYYENGIPMDRWAVATADTSGSFHDGEKQSTPTGIFNLQRMVYCPKWQPASFKDKSTGLVVEEKLDRQAYFNKRPATFGPCGAKNPLGNFVMWFQQPYGFHGNANENIMANTNPSARRVSGGCVRNPNHKIEEIFMRILTKSPSMNNFKKRIESSRAKVKKQMIAYEADHLDVKFIIGKWNDSIKLTQNSIRDRFKSEKPTDFDTYCQIKKAPGIDSLNPVQFTSLDSLPQSLEKLQITASEGGLYKTSYGWLPQKLFFSCKPVANKNIILVEK